MLLAPEPVAALYTTDEDIRALAITLVKLAGVFVIVDIRRGIGDYEGSFDRCHHLVFEDGGLTVELSTIGGAFPGARQ